MKHRESLSASMFTAGMTAIAGGAIFVAGIVIQELAQTPVFAVFGIIGFFIGFIAIIRIQLGGNCLKCKNSLGRAFTSFGTIHKVPDKIMFCPFCGVDLDSEIEN